VIKLDIVNAVVATDEHQPHQSPSRPSRTVFRIVEAGARPRPSASNFARFGVFSRSSPARTRHRPANPPHRRRGEHSRRGKAVRFQNPAKKLQGYRRTRKKKPNSPLFAPASNHSTKESSPPIRNWRRNTSSCAVLVSGALSPIFAPTTS